MRTAVVGTGYVGLVTGTCLADVGHSVWCVDVEIDKINRLKQGQLPIYEPGLPVMIRRNVRANRLRFTTDIVRAVQASELVFVTVGTPPREDGSVDTSHFLQAIRDIARSMNGPKIIVGKSTVPVGTGVLVNEMLQQLTSHPFSYVSNPEFLKEGSAVDDFTSPARVVIGGEDRDAIEALKEIHKPFMDVDEGFIVTDTTSAELAKYAANAMLAARISFMNEIAEFSETVGADVERVREILAADPRIGSAFLASGVGFGGFCLPKDVRALRFYGEQAKTPMEIMTAVHNVNQHQRDRFCRRVLEYFGQAVRGATLAVWGLAYKARTDDVRESPAIWCVKQLVQAGLRVRAYDPQAMPKARQELPPSVQMYEDLYDVLDGADALAIFTDWPEFLDADLPRVAERMTGDAVFDGRNLYDPDRMARIGFAYHSIGRPSPDLAAFRPTARGRYVQTDHPDSVLQRGEDLTGGDRGAASSH